ncbi:MAG: AMP-binding protein [Gemmatimonadota bacterium]
MIRQYYDGRCLLVTGATGFVGQAVIAKVLRDLPGVRRVYALIRPRRRTDGQVISPPERLEREILGESVFGAFRRQDPEGFRAARSKVVAVSGDVTAPGLGLDPAVREELLGELDTIINSAATVVFDEPLDQSIRLNARGPLALLELARACRKRVDLVHVSTAYVNGQWTGTIPEAPLPLDRDVRTILAGGDDPFDPEAEILACEASCEAVRDEAAGEARTREFRREILRQRRRRNLTRSRLKELVEDRRRRWTERRLVSEGMGRAKARGWHDVYSFTKALGEQVLVKRRGDQPLVIVRPSIIESSLEDPEPGWITGLKVMDPLVAAYGRGMMPDFPLQRGLVLDLIPVDLVVNALLAAATQCVPEEVRVYQVATSTENPVTVDTLFDEVRAYFRAHPMLDRDGRAPRLYQWTYPSLWRFQVLFRLKYLVPVSVQEWVLGKLPARLAPAARRRLLASLKIRLGRVLYYTDIYYPYTHLECRFETRRTRALYESLPDDEQRVFNIDVRRLDWRQYLREIHVPGLRRHVLRDDPTGEVLLRGAPDEMGAAEERWQAEEEVQTLPDLLHWSSARYGGRTAFQVRRGGDWVRLTYRELAERALAQAAAWQAAGLCPGDRLVLCGANSPEWVVSYMAASVLGMAVVPLAPETPAAELWRLAALTRARALVVARPQWRRLASTSQAAPRELMVLDLDHHGSPMTEPRSEAPRLDREWLAPGVAPEMEASIIYTSGTAVQPRGVVLTHGNLVADTLALSEVHPVREGDHCLSVMPLHQGLEFTAGLLTSMLGGASVTFLESVNSRRMLESMGETRTTVLLAPPRLLKILLDRVHRLEPPPQAGPQTALLRRLRLVVSGGAPLAPGLLAAYRELGVEVHEAYGLTEAGPVVTASPPGGARPGSVGQPLPGVEVQIQDPDAEGRGEVLVRGPMVMQGYLDQPELTAQVLRDGWLHTGDLGYLDGDGHLFLEGRTRALIVNGGGANVYPEEVEELYRGLPHVAELAVVGVANPRILGEEIHGVAVVRRASRSAAVPAPVEEEIRSRAHSVSRELPAFHRIQHLHLWPRPLPRLDDGTVNRQTLRTELERARGQAESVPGIDEGVAPWERAAYARLGEITGLSPGELLVQADAPLDTFLDSLMAVEFAATLEPLSGAGGPPLLDRTRSLREVLDGLVPAAGEAVGGLTDAAPFWSSVLAQAAGTAPVRGAGLLRRLFWGATAGAFRRYFSMQVEGLEHLPAGRAFLLAANHTSHLDAPAVLVALRGCVDDLTVASARDYFFTSSVWRWAFRRLTNAIPFERSAHFQESLKRAAAAVSPGRPLLVFPEGTRSPSGRLQPFKAGLGLLAVELEVPIVPLHIAGTYQALPKNSPRLRRHPVTVRFGPPIDVAPFGARRQHLGSYETYREVAEAVQRQVEALARGEVPAAP